MYLARSTLLSSSTRSSSTRLDLDSSRYLLGLILDLYRFSIIITHGHAWGTCVQKH